MSTFYVIIRRPSTWSRPPEVVETFRGLEVARAALDHIHDAIDDYHARCERYWDECKRLGEAWFRASGLRDRKYSIDEILEGGAEIGHRLSLIVHYSNAVEAEPYVYVHELRQAVAELRTLFKVHAPAPDWPPEPTRGAYDGSKSDYVILVLEVPD